MRNIHTKIISLNRWHVGACCLCLRLLTFTVGAPTPFTPFNTPWRRWREGEWKSDPSAFNESQWNLYICIDQRRRICHKKGGKKTASPDSKLCCKIHHFSVKFIPVNSTTWLESSQHRVLLKWKPQFVQRDHSTHRPVLEEWLFSSCLRIWLHSSWALMCWTTTAQSGCMASDWK